MLAAGAVVLAACGGGDGASGAQGEVVDLLMEAADADAIEIDRDCASDLASDLSDADAEAIVDAGLDGDVDVSAAADAIGEQIFDECVDISSIIDSAVAELEGEEGVDAECVRETLGAATTADEVFEQLFDAMLDCSDG